MKEQIKTIISIWILIIIAYVISFSGYYIFDNSILPLWILFMLLGVTTILIFLIQYIIHPIIQKIDKLVDKYFN